MNLIEKKPWIFTPSWIALQEAISWEEKLIHKINWQQPIVRVFGKKYKVPRLTCFLADNDISYFYSDLKQVGQGWPKWFLPLLDKTSDACNVKFNGCLLNFYRDGNDHMGWHTDNEKELDSSKPIASLSFGSSRDFFFKNKKENIKITQLIGNGDLLVMNPVCQRDWIHSLPIRKKNISPRINLTFRCYL